MSRLVCSCGWDKEISNKSPLHWKLAEFLPPCPRRRWWNGWRHQVHTEMDLIGSLSPEPLRYVDWSVWFTDTALAKFTTLDWASMGPPRSGTWFVLDVEGKSHYITMAAVSQITRERSSYSPAPPSRPEGT